MAQPAQPDAGQPLPIRLRDLITGYWAGQGIYVAAKLKLADYVTDGPKTAEELARATGTHAPSLYRLLRALASSGVFAEDDQHRFGLTPMAELLRSDVPMSQRALAVMMGDPEHYDSWGKLLYSIRTGEPSFEKIYGKGVFAHLAENPEPATVFDEAMTGVHGVETQAMLDAYDFTGIGTLVDVGGGNGSLLLSVLEKYPSLQGVVYDQPHVVERTRQRIEQARLAARCRTVGGSFFQEVPPGGDAYLMRHIIHDWDDTESRAILANCRQAMKPGARLLLVESVIKTGNDRDWTKWLDINMLVLPGGMERTEEQYRALFDATGFCLSRIVPTYTEMSVIEAEPV